MIYYECIESMALYKKHKVAEIEVITETPVYFSSPWLRIRTEEGVTFYIEKKKLEDMNRFPEFYPTEKKERYRFAPAQEDKKEAVPA